jgi:5S rRNA maturation endonuclease (ribonuclease M5)
MAFKNSTSQKRGYIDVDSLQRELVAGGDAVEQIASFYNVQLPDLHKIRNETRMECIFNCGKEQETGDRAISIKTNLEGALFRCFQYGCTVRGNLLNLMYLMKHDHEPTDGRLKGSEFKEIAQDLQALVDGSPPELQSKMQSTKQLPKDESDESPLINIPLKNSENERAKELVDLDDRFIIDVEEMSPKAASYVRKRPFMTPEMMEKFHCGYLPNNAGSLLRGHFVYGYPDADWNILTWFGRNLNYEEQQKKWQRSGDSTKEPRKFKFVKGFHRGQELFGEPQFHELSTPEQIQQTGIVLVEGPNDVINLHSLGIPALAVCSNLITETQADKLVELANGIFSGFISVMFDLDKEGVIGAKQAVLELAKRCKVKLAWSNELADGKFKDRQPESVTREEWNSVISQI